MHRIILTTLICLLLLSPHSLLAGKSQQPEKTLLHPTNLSEGTKGKTGSVKIPARPALSATKADLEIRSFSCSPPAVQKGKTATLRAVVVNTGKDKAADFDVAFYQKGKLIGKKQRLSVAPGQSIQVVSAFRPEQSGRLAIQVHADSGKAVAETNEKNNTGDVILTVSKPTPTKQSEPPLPSLTKKTPSSAITEKPAAGITLESKIKPPTPADLALEQIRYHQDSASLPSKILSTSKSGISCVIRNSGAAQLDPQQFRQSRIDITINRKPLPGFFRLEQIVTYNRIAKPGSHATAWIPVELKGKSAISITINSNGAISETNMTNNSSSGVLGGAAAKPTIATKTALRDKASAVHHKLPGGRSLIRPDKEIERPTKPKAPGSTMPSGLRMTMERPAAAQRSAGKVTPKLLDHGIEIISPNFEDVYSPSSLIPIRYRFSRTAEAGGTVVFTMVGGGEEVATLHIRNDNPPGPANPHRQVELQLPGGIDAGSYLISARHEASGAAGLSDMFRVISLRAEEIEGSAEEIGDAGGFGGDGTATLPYFEPLQAYPVKDDDSIGDGGGFGGPGEPTLAFVNDLSGTHINPLYYSLNAATLGWVYYGPLDAAPERWQLDLIDPVTSTVEETDLLSCDDRVDTPASASQALPSRRCSALFRCRDRDGSYRLRLSGAGLSTETSGMVHCGIDELRPSFTWFNVSPATVIQGEPITYGFTWTPPESELAVQLLRDGEAVYSRLIPRQAADGEYATVEGRIETDDLLPGTGNYRLEVYNRYSGVGLSSDAISILEPPFAETDDNAVDFRLSGLRVSNEGQLQVNTAISAAAGGVRVLSYRLAYMVGKDDGSTPISYRRLERDIPASGGWISLGHIHSFTTADERRAADLLRLRVLVNQPVEIVERTYDNNSIREHVWIRGSYAICRLSNAPGETYLGDGVLRYETDPQWPSNTLTGLDLVCYNRGFEDVTGTIEVIQYREVPGELRSETVSLGNTTHFEPATDDTRMEGATRRLTLFSDRSGISSPRPGNGELRIILRGPLYFTGDRQERTLEFRQR